MVDKVVCLGRNLEEHCCWVDGSPCKFLEENTQPGFRWTCGLRRELGSWSKVIADPRYVTEILPKHRIPNMNCRNWPSVERTCNVCGAGK